VAVAWIFDGSCLSILKPHSSIFSLCFYIKLPSVFLTSSHLGFFAFSLVLICLEKLGILLVTISNSAVFVFIGFGPKLRLSIKLHFTTTLACNFELLSVEGSFF